VKKSYEIYSKKNKLLFYISIYPFTMLIKPWFIVRELLMKGLRMIKKI
tara:strand:- start:2540 stop:2683 length:144 start_codon:yes stop_codon:yes gene_type:complete